MNKQTFYKVSEDMSMSLLDQLRQEGRLYYVSSSDELVQKAVSSGEKKAKEIMKASHAIRFALIIVLLAISLIFQSVFNVIATIISLLFATFGVYLRAVFNKDKKKQAKSGEVVTDENTETAGGDEK